MLKRRTGAGLGLLIGLVLSAGVAQAQAPIVDAGSVSGPVNLDSQPVREQSMGELYYQMQLMQREIMELRGLVEEQGFQLEKLKQQNLDRYVDLDRRIGRLGSGGSVSGSSEGSKPSATIKGDGQAEITGSNEIDDYRDAYGLVKARKFAEAIDAFNQFLDQHPSGRYVPNALYWLGELYLVNTPQDLVASRQAFKRLIDNHPDNNKVPDALYKLGKVLYLEGDKKEAKEVLNRVIEQYGSTGTSAAKLSRQFLRENY